MLSQVGCNVSIAGSEAAGGRWWRFTCGIITPATAALPPAADLEQQAVTSRSWLTVLQQRHKLQSNKAGYAHIPNRDKVQHLGSGSGPHSADDDDDPSGSVSGYASCGPAVQGPMLIVVLERVQSGLLGAALSAFGITGLYFSVVFGE